MIEFECTRCGDCCRPNWGGKWAFAHVPLHAHEREAIAEFLGVELSTIPEFIDITHSACPWLTEDNECSIQPVKPINCSAWPWIKKLNKPSGKEWMISVCPGLTEVEDDDD